jgi:tRNA(Ile)-lysidine synthase
MINTKKNLLAFSGGIDSTALFFLLLADNIKFDVAIVDYNQRQQSKEEIAYAKKLCKLYNKKCFTKEFPKKIKFTEKKARDFRYNFFEEIIAKEGYTTLLTAHQLNDKFEWFLMQFSRGAGLSELIGLEDEEQRKNYTIKRPLLKYTKQELINFLEKKEIKYFVDKTNFNTKYTRNHIRKIFANDFIKQYSNGVKRSFEYLKKDVSSLLSNIKSYQNDELIIFDLPNDENITIRIIDKELKKRGILISKATRDEILRQKEIVINNKIAISITNTKIWIAPKCDLNMTKKFKEQCRKNKIPKNIRKYLFSISTTKNTNQNLNYF